MTFVVHDWGSALGFDWANRHRDTVKGVAYMEAIVQPVAWRDWPDQARALFQAFRSPAGEDMVLQKNIFVETVLPRSILRGLTDAEMEVYRRPYREPGESRRPTLTWPRQIPIEGEPADVTEIVQFLRRMARRVRDTQVVHQRRAGSDPDRKAKGLLPDLAEPEGDHG